MPSVCGVCVSFSLNKKKRKLCLLERLSLCLQSRGKQLWPGYHGLLLQLLEERSQLLVGRSSGVLVESSRVRCFRHSPHRQDWKGKENQRDAAEQTTFGRGIVSTKTQLKAKHRSEDERLRPESSDLESSVSMKSDFSKIEPPDFSHRPAPTGTRFSLSEVAKAHGVERGGGGGGGGGGRTTL
ncbi:uncharacterized protein V6R79_004191 [Siganus canaliculatus]